jgi:hypothetical protein
MAGSMVIEEESGTYTARRHPHNGYYAGDFSGRRDLTRFSTTSGARMARPSSTTYRTVTTLRTSD